jgi:hypothetical protein
MQTYDSCLFHRYYLFDLLIISIIFFLLRGMGLLAAPPGLQNQSHGKRQVSKACFFGRSRGEFDSHCPSPEAK